MGILSVTFATPSRWERSERSPNILHVGWTRPQPPALPPGASHVTNVISPTYCAVTGCNDHHTPAFLSAAKPLPTPPHVSLGTPARRSPCLISAYAALRYDLGVTTTSSKARPSLGHNGRRCCDIDPTTFSQHGTRARHSMKVPLQRRSPTTRV
jgi:hypothetical protein